VFPIQSGAQQPDLTAGTAGSFSYATTSHFAFNLTGTLDDVGFPAAHGGRNTCAIISDL